MPSCKKKKRGGACIVKNYIICEGGQTPAPEPEPADESAYGEMVRDPHQPITYFNQDPNIFNLVTMDGATYISGMSFSSGSSSLAIEKSGVYEVTIGGNYSSDAGDYITFVAMENGNDIPESKVSQNTYPGYVQSFSRTFFHCFAPGDSLYLAFKPKNWGDVYFEPAGAKVSARLISPKCP
jgi:hypothetical protein